MQYTVTDMDEIYQMYSKKILNYLYFHTRDRELAEDLMQETFYKATKKINTFRNDCELIVWLHQIAKNLWKDELKKMKRMKEVELKEEIAAEFDMEEELYDKEQKSKMYQQLNGLKGNAKELMFLRIVNDMSFKEIGDILGETENWARTNFYRTKEKIKEMNREEEKKYERK